MKNCVDSAEMNHEFSAEIFIDNEKYSGCANQNSSLFVSGKIGKLSTLLNMIKFLNATNFEYKGNISRENGKYIMYGKGRLIEISIWDDPLHDDDSEKHEFIVIYMSDRGPEILWMWGKNVDPEICEKHRFIRWIHNFGVFDNCPKG